MGGAGDAAYGARDREIWERIFAEMPDDWLEAPPSDAMRKCREYFAARRCRRVLDLGCGFGRWAHDLLTHRAVTSVVGLDYAFHGVRAASAWADRAGFNARFVVASATDPPFRVATFDGVVCALLLDGLSRDDRRRTLDNLAPVLRPSAHGFFVFNPILSPADRDAHRDNPTRDCLHVSYADEELPELLSGWTVEAIERSAEGFRVVTARFAP